MSIFHTFYTVCFDLRLGASRTRGSPTAFVKETFLVAAENAQNERRDRVDAKLPRSGYLHSSYGSPGVGEPFLDTNQHDFQPVCLGAITAHG